jgi:hypothetical protein
VKISCGSARLVNVGALATCFREDHTDTVVLQAWEEEEKRKAVARGTPWEHHAGRSVALKARWACLQINCRALPAAPLQDAVSR